MRSQLGWSAGWLAGPSCNRVLRCGAGVGVVLTAGSLAHAWEFRARIVERVGNQDVVWPGNIVDASDGSPRNMRVQFGVFDDAEGVAPLGGFVGWNFGTIVVSGAADNSDERRNNGRIAPFNFSPGLLANGNPPAPQGDPFTMLTNIDSTLGTQSPIWTCDPNGVPLPMPAAIVRGWNTFVSVYAFQIDPRDGATSYTVTLGGNLIAANGWFTVGTPQPPDCGEPGPIPEQPGIVLYAPDLTAPREFTAALTVVVPAPSSVLLATAGLALARRRSRSIHVNHGKVLS